MKKFLLSFLSLAIAVFSFSPLRANTVTVPDPASGTAIITTAYLPTAINGGTGENNAYYSVSQQLYYASELTDASTNTIRAITFYTNGGPTITRKLRVWLNNTTLTAFPSTKPTKNTPNLVAPGSEVCLNDAVNITPNASYTLTFDTPFEWDGTSNIVITVYDYTGEKNSTGTAGATQMFATEAARFMHKTNNVNTQSVGWDMNNLTTAVANGVADRGYVNKITFTFADVVIPAPTFPTATGITSNSANIAWTASAGSVDSYEIRYGTTSGSLGDWTNVGNVTSYSLDGLEAATRYYYQVRAKKGDAYSAPTTEAYFNTSAHEHDEITFTKWNYSGTLPSTTGNYYLAQNVTLSSNWDPSGTINLCLNGKTVNMGDSYGQIDGGTSVTIYDDAGTGMVTSSNSAQTFLVSGSSTNLTMKGCYVENTSDGFLLKSDGNAEVMTQCPLNMADNENNASLIRSHEYITANVSLTRSLTSTQYNTFCLPFALTDAQLQSVFGTGYDLQELTASSLTGETLNLEFTKRTALEAGKPYLLQPSVNVTNPVVFEGVTITATSPGTSTTDYVDYKAVYSPTSLAGGNRNLLFLGAGNELFWPESTGNLNGFRAYFEVKGAAQKAAKRARISMGGKIATGNLSPALPQEEGVKILRDGKLYLMYKGQMYDVQGKRI